MTAMRVWDRPHLKLQHVHVAVLASHGAQYTEQLLEPVVGVLKYEALADAPFLCHGDTCEGPFHNTLQVRVILGRQKARAVLAVTNDN